MFGKEALGTAILVSGISNDGHETEYTPQHSRVYVARCDSQYRGELLSVANIQVLLILRARSVEAIDCQGPEARANREVVFKKDAHLFEGTRRISMLGVCEVYDNLFEQRSEEELAPYTAHETGSANGLDAHGQLKVLFGKAVEYV